MPLLVAIYLVIISARLDISDLKLIRGNKTENTELQFSSNDIKHDESFLITFNLFAKNKAAKISIIPDDCIQEILINGKKFPLYEIENLCGYGGKEVNLDFSKYIQKDLNRIEIRIINSGGGPGGIRITTYQDGFRGLSLIHCFFAFLFLLSTALILRKLKFKFAAISIMLLGIAVRLILYTYTGPMQNAYDTFGHLDYIRIISEEKRLPNSNECWQCYQPSLYYISFAVVKNIADKYNPALTNRILQQGNLLLSFACVVLGVTLILNLFGNRREAYLAALVSVLWPGFVLAAPRISNDILFYFGAMLCMLFAQKYWLANKNSDMLLASIGASIALMAKSNGLVILVAWVIIYILSSVRCLRTGSLRTVLVSVFIILLSLGISSHRIIVDVFEGKRAELVTNTSSLPDDLKVKNRIDNYIYFDLQGYLNDPYVDSFNDKGGRQYFWNYALKTSLFGNFRLWNSNIGRIFATVLDVLVLPIFMLALWSIIHIKFKDLPPMIFMVSLLAALICYRIIYPYASSNDFRYIFPVLFPIAYFSVQGAQILQNSRLRVLSYAATVAFAVMVAFAVPSFAFIVGMGF